MDGNSLFSRTASGIVATDTISYHPVPINGRAAAVSRISVTQLVGDPPANFEFALFEDDPRLYDGSEGPSQSESDGSETGNIPVSAIQATSWLTGTAGRFLWVAAEAQTNPYTIVARGARATNNTHPRQCWVGIRLTSGTTGTFAVTLAGERE